MQLPPPVACADQGGHSRAPCAAAGLLHNWGVGLHSLGTHAADAAEAAAALHAAAQRLQDSAAFSRADPAPLNALGDVRMAQVRDQGLTSLPVSAWRGPAAVICKLECGFITPSTAHPAAAAGSL